MNALEFAIKMELDGERYYREQAVINQGNSLRAIFLMLADDEKMHAQILEKKAKNLNYTLEPNETLATAKNVFNDKDRIKNEIKEIPSQIDVYRAALDNEKESILLYQKCASEAADGETKTLFDYLILQEKEHYAILEQLTALLSRSEEWVEDAEFGLREDY
ncbi:ferritin-like domain-containing protein [Desulfitobacterium hafniense]|uniref:ferritin-like domain-containing protein n=1 Tax=Desulfitobacterium hafniense TaxID=49338 RepID=UPI00037864DA|nr:ferritin family protein [Desulfitobacterium hafniense]